MDIQKIEYAARMFFKMCEMHPEICPHDYLWLCSTINDAGEEVEQEYKCRICGKEIKKIL